MVVIQRSRHFLGNDLVFLFEYGFVINSSVLLQAVLLVHSGANFFGCNKSGFFPHPPPLSALVDFAIVLC